MLCTGGIFILKYILIELCIPNLSQIFFCNSEIFKTSLLIMSFDSTKYHFEFVDVECVVKFKSVIL